MDKLRKAGLLLMLLSFVYYITFAAVHGLNEYYDLFSNITVGLIYSVPCLFVTIVSWLWPRRGGIASLVIPILLVTLSTVSIMTSKVPLTGQEYPVLSLTEISTFILPYAILLSGSILAFISARKAGITDLLPGVKDSNIKVDKLHRTGLLTMFISGIVGILSFVIIIGIAGDSGIASNLFGGMVMGLTFATLPLIVVAVSWYWPFKGGVFAIGFSAAWLVFFTITRMSDYIVHMPWMFAEIVLPSIIVLLVGGSLVFIYSKRVDAQNTTTGAG